MVFFFRTVKWILIIFVTPHFIDKTESKASYNTSDQKQNNFLKLFIMTISVNWKNGCGIVNSY